MFLFPPSPHKHPSFSSFLTIQSANSHTIPTPRNSRQSRTINTHNATSIPISLPHRISVLQMQLLFFICRSHILKLLCRNPAAQQLFLFPLCRSFYLLFQLQVIDRIRDCHVPHTFRRSMNRNHARKTQPTKIQFQ